ncbi:PREDICTED: glucagon-like peptide 1 receptor [Chrysochloris asiatica]|uniref:Glucagon-like peptide 1 receptor n=1 Tax=Chrysochloris asiatica TaxID=185453 RepID=A0A9B0WMT6_CHRAS|nr:PREDICTED: glucagon-like peptide 1 receptor [Chrysochloris asiatica]
MAGVPGPLRLVLLLLGTVGRAGPRPQGATVSLSETVQKWREYRKDCQHFLTESPPPATGLFCNRTFDDYACWPDGLPGSFVNVSCPWYLPWANSGEPHHYISSLPCIQEAEAWGHLHCTRNYIHLNLFASFILRALSVFIKDAALKWMYSTAAQQHQWDGLLSYQDSVGCRLVFLLMQYCVAANYYWLLVEGVYLYTLLAFSVFSEQRVFRIYLSIGWGVPLLFVTPWGIIKYLYEDEGCWTRNSNMNYWLIIRLPILFAIGVNFLIFVRVICIVVAKLKANLMCKTDIKCRLAKSTLTLIPLLGTHEVIFAFVMDEHARGTLRFIKLFTELSFTSFQGLMVAILYCFVNNEVQMEFQKSWERWRLEHLHIQRDSSMKPLKCPTHSLSSGGTVGSSVYAATCQASCS